MLWCRNKILIDIYVYINKDKLFEYFEYLLINLCIKVKKILLVYVYGCKDRLFLL